MNNLIIINDAPYGTEKAYNALRLANQILTDKPETAMNIFLMADAVTCGIPEQKTPNGYYNIERLVKIVVKKGGALKTCGTCMDARGMAELSLIHGVERGTLAELSQWSIEADKIITF